MKSFIKDNQTKSLGFTASNAGNAFTLSVVFLLIFSLVWTVVLTVFKIEGDFTAFANYIPAPLAVICALLTFYIRGKKDCFKLLKPRKVPSFTILSAALIMIGLLFGLSKLNDYFVTFIRQFMPSYEDATLPSYTP